MRGWEFKVGFGYRTAAFVFRWGSGVGFEARLWSGREEGRLEGLVVRRGRDRRGMGFKICDGWFEVARFFRIETEEGTSRATEKT